MEVRSWYGIDIPADEPESAADTWLDGRKGIAVADRGDCAEVRGPRLLDGSACHLLGQRIVARGRIVILEMMERILASAPDVQICYANIDSIHFSLPTRNLGRVLALLETEASEALGSFKIEAVAKHGLWLEPGRYWLYSDTEVVKFRNRSVGDRSQPFKDHAVYVANRQIGDLNVPVRTTLSMECTMSSSRSLEITAKDGLARQQLIEVGCETTFGQVLDKLERNQRQAVPARMRAFVKLREKLHSSRIAASKREENASIM